MKISAKQSGEVDDKQIGYHTGFTEKIIEDMAPLPMEDAFVMIKLEEENLEIVNNILNKMGFKDSQIARF